MMHNATTEVERLESLLNDFNPARRSAALDDLLALVEAGDFHSRPNEISLMPTATPSFHTMPMASPRPP
jgi:hypothetical protein